MGAPDRIHLLAELWRTIDHNRKEWDITYAEAIGCVEVIKARLIREVFGDDEKAANLSATRKECNEEDNPAK